MLEDTTTLAELLPGLAALPDGPTREVVGSPLLHHLGTEGPPSWAGLSLMSTKEIATIPNMGPIRTKRVLSTLASLVGADLERREIASSVAAAGPEPEVIAAVREIAAWATGSGRGGSLEDAFRAAVGSDDSDVPLAALETLRGVAAVDVAPRELVARYDPVATAEALIGSFDERQRATLDRVLDFDGSAPTLQQLGERFDVTRERIRQIEDKVKQRLSGALAEPATRSLVAAADRLRGRLGGATPADALAGEFAEFPPDLLDRLILHLAGPYRFDGEWYVLDELTPFSETVQAVFESVAVNGVATLDGFSDALVEQGIRPDHIDRVLSGLVKLRVIEDQVVDWSGSLASKSVIALHLVGRPLSLGEIAEIVEPNSERGMSNQIHADERIVKVGPSRFALPEWELDEYHGVVASMSDRLVDGAMPLPVLRDQLAGEFGVSPASVTIMSGTHPAFLVEDGLVMLRPDDRPYEPDTALDATRYCYLVDGVWSWRVPVDKDILRGSGRAMPEAFAVHLGATPLEKGEVDSPIGPIRVSWFQNPNIGSLRAAARSLDADHGDWLFVRRVTPSMIDFQLLRAAEVPADPEGRLKSLIGAAGTSASVEKALADALGLRGTVNHDLSEEREKLSARREHDLVELLDLL